MAVLRTYRAQVAPEHVEKYIRFERTEGVPMVAARPGCQGVGFARVRETTEPTFVFFSLWRSQADLDAARTSTEWKAVVAKLTPLNLTVGEDVAEHWEVETFHDGIFPTKPLSRPQE